MNWIIIVVAIILIAAISIVKLSKKSTPVKTTYPYQKAETLFSPAERSFLGILDQVVDSNARILGKVRVADVVNPIKGLNRSDWQKAFNKISSKHFDFLLCSNDNLAILCAIELNDSSHQTKSRQQRDDFLSEVCNSAKIPLIQIPAKSGYVINDIKEIITPHLNYEKTPNNNIDPLQESTNNKLCPKCNSPMTKRIAKKGSHAGEQFWACSAYPKCKHLETINS